jgi:hypothetical protein
VALFPAAPVKSETTFWKQLSFCFKNLVSDFTGAAGTIIEPHKTPATPPSKDLMFQKEGVSLGYVGRIKT